jgi:hypothetical protein
MARASLWSPIAPKSVDVLATVPSVVAVSISCAAPGAGVASC